MSSNETVVRGTPYLMLQKGPLHGKAHSHSCWQTGGLTVNNRRRAAVYVIAKIITPNETATVMAKVSSAWYKARNLQVITPKYKADRA